MAFNLLGLLPQQQPNQMQTLLGEYYDPKQARMAWLGGTLQGLGAGLASGRPGAWAQGLAMGGNPALDDYRQRAAAMYGIKQRQDETAYQRGRDAAADKRWQTQFDYNKGRDQKSDAWNNTVRDRQLEQWQLEDDKRAAQENYVTGWMQDQSQMGAGLPMSPGVRAIGRAGGVEGPSAVNQWRYDNAAPYAGAQDYGNALNQIAAQPESTAPNWKETTLDDGVYWVDQNNPANRIKMGERPNRNEGEGRGFTQEKQLRSEYMTESKPFTDLRTNYQKIQASSQDTTGASDIALVYSFMKMLDPTSVVREGEFATAENAGGIDSKITTLYNNVLNGQRLSPQVRKDFVTQAGRQYSQQAQTYQQIKKKYADLASKLGLDPDNVAPDITYGVQASADEGSSGNPAVDDILKKYPPKN